MTNILSIGVGRVLKTNNTPPKIVAIDIILVLGGGLDNSNFLTFHLLNKSKFYIYGSGSKDACRVKRALWQEIPRMPEKINSNFIAFLSYFNIFVSIRHQIEPFFDFYEKVVNKSPQDEFNELS